MKAGKVPQPYSRGWLIAALAMLGIAIARGIRFPSLWSYSHFLFNYQYGFTKRGLIGEIFRRLGDPYFVSYRFFVFFSLAIFLLNVFLLALVIRDIIASKNIYFSAGALVFASSLAVVFLSHTVGYFDQVGLLVALVSLRIHGFNKKVLFLLPAWILAILVHENLFVIFFPVTFMSLLFGIDPGEERKKGVIMAGFSVLLVALLLFVSSWTLRMKSANAMYGGLQQKTGISLRHDAFRTLSLGIERNYVKMKKRAARPSYFADLSASLLVTLPALLLFLFFTWRTLKGAKRNFFVVGLSILASISPLALHFMAWDMNRWNTLAITTSFLMWVAAFSAPRPAPEAAAMPRVLWPALLLVLFLNGASTIELFDGYHVKPFPFIEHGRYIQKVISRQEPFPYIPRQ